MALSDAIMDNYSRILHEELIPAMGCTEPIAIAYAAAKAKATCRKKWSVTRWIVPET